MSKFFEALIKTDTSIAEAVLQPIEREREANGTGLDITAAISSAMGEGTGVETVETGTGGARQPSAITPAEDTPTVRQSGSGQSVVASHTGSLEGVREIPARLAAGSPLLPFDGADDTVAEQYRILRTNLINSPRSPRILCVSSASMGDGKSVNAINIAGALALKQDTKVLLIDGDLRRPAVARMLGITASPGLADVLAGRVSWQQAVMRIAQIPNLYCMPVGEVSLPPAELLDSQRLRAMCQGLRTVFDFIIIDSVPVGMVADYDLIEAVTDGAVLIIRPDHSDRKALLHAIETLSSRGKLVGTVMNCAKPWFLWKGGNERQSYKAYINRDPMKLN